MEIDWFIEGQNDKSFTTFGELPRKGDFVYVRSVRGGREKYVVSVAYHKVTLTLNCMHNVKVPSGLEPAERYEAAVKIVESQSQGKVYGFDHEANLKVAIQRGEVLLERATDD